MSTNPTGSQEENGPPPLTPGFEENGKVQFLGPDRVKYISPPRNLHSQHRYESSIAPPPYPSYPQLQMPNQIPVHMQQMQMPISYMPPPQPPQMIQSYQQPQMMYLPPTMAPQPIMMQPTMMPMTQQPSAAPNINVVVNSSPTSQGGGTELIGIGGANGGGTISGAGALVCPKCRKGILTRKQDRKRKKILFCLAICCCPITCGLPLFWLCCNFVDTCACCGKQYGHRGRKAAKNKVGAVKL